MSVKNKKDNVWIQRALVIVFMDILAVLASYMLALFMRFDFVFSKIPRVYLEGYLWSMPFWVISTVVVFYACRLYHSIWRLASVAEVRRIIAAYIILVPIQIFGMLFMHLRMPRSYYFMGYIICLCLTTGIRFSYRLLRLYTSPEPAGWSWHKGSDYDYRGRFRRTDAVKGIIQQQAFEFEGMLSDRRQSFQERTFARGDPHCWGQK